MKRINSRYHRIIKAIRRRLMSRRREMHLLGCRPLHLIDGELYLFHRLSPACPTEESMWGVFHKFEAGTIHLESSSWNLHAFSLWHRLPDGYRYCRLATRAELRDYIAALVHFEIRRR